ncbi:ABC transporter substrate-binding protein [Pelagibacterium sp. 26DY04]|uniref:ABC transporter substrate-binding protein n=1 Tax=Pelagibacterium sp. 26DY04 TaxID=2967130 RepID=UPI0028161BC6|nr:ABC transporter substrate-binding protein [Pelagibacterium sp. 26DY04]WMT86058.1 ABC transporter substrate-binding protein [Pelagibacterium sp. 26DY04]
MAIAVGLAMSAAAQEFPQTFEHRFGTTVIDDQPERVVTLTYSGADHYLALGVVPVGLRHWYGDFPHSVWPWAQGALGDAEPFVLTEIDYEQIAALEPDVIEGIGSGLTQEQYDELSRIAPVVAAEAQYTDFSTPWAERARTVGRILGQEDGADRLVSDLEARITSIAAAHPEWNGMEAVIAFNVTYPGVYRSVDIRAQLLEQLGFSTPAAIDALGEEGDFNVEISEEDLTLLEADLLVWIIGAGSVERIEGLALRERLTAHQEGREVFADYLLSGAFSFATPLSLNYLLDRLEPLIEAAVDGDPGTPVETTMEAGLAP